MTETCGTCRFWVGADRQHPITMSDAACRRRAPVALSRESYGRVDPSWPMVWHNYWCGDYDPLPTPIEAPAP